MEIIPITLFFDGDADQALSINYGPNAAPGLNISLPINYIYGCRISPPSFADSIPQIPRIMILINEFAADAFNSPVKYHAVLTMDNAASRAELNTRFNNNGEYWFEKPILPPSTLSFTFSNGLQSWSRDSRVIIPVVFYCTVIQV
jgi:hypothetical protein